MNKLTKIKNKIKLTVKMKFKKDRAEKIKLSNIPVQNKIISTVNLHIGLLDQQIVSCSESNQGCAGGKVRLFSKKYPKVSITLGFL